MEPDPGLERRREWASVINIVCPREQIPIARAVDKLITEARSAENFS